MPAYSKQSLWHLLEADAKPFAVFLHRVLFDQNAVLDDDDRAIAVMFDSVSGVDLAAPVIQMYALPVLVSKGILTQATIDRINAHIE